MTASRVALPLALALLLAAAPLSATEPVQAQPERLLVLVPFGDVNPKILEITAAELRERFRLRVEVHSSIPHPEAAWYTPRKRWRAEKLLDALDALHLPEAWRVTGITEAPISTTKGDIYDWGIAGLANLDGKSSVLTAYLFQKVKAKDPKRYQRYLENLGLHEVGHTFGLEHCPLDRCIMADAKGNAIRAANLSINEFCPRCHRLIAGSLRSSEVRGTWSKQELLILDQADAGPP